MEGTALKGELFGLENLLQYNTSSILKSLRSKFSRSPDSKKKPQEAVSGVLNASNSVNSVESRIAPLLPASMIEDAMNASRVTSILKTFVLAQLTKEELEGENEDSALGNSCAVTCSDDRTNSH